ncbi:GNAT family N-acetyltransferase [Tepidibacter hydrothermalis]|uniref:GNAT family N-acetyltransferase n=1 Tax=Tepidibacter hydrothermalis TaxID=3036126 RepID=A0ABY8E7L9_9FIRM|nr:GNAT family N-acetyltransferase [Tepidibacter hydrothermalis]WFD08903.1 GNAT family N-acetyltransferase [Tepidibacter hydrothermalis]
MIRKAVLSDLDNIMEIIKETIKEMHSYNNYQWDDNYPKSKDFANDIEKGDLYVEDMNGQVCGFICVNYLEPDEYNGLNWSVNEKAMVIHRMAVDSRFRKKGIGTSLMKFAEELAINNGSKYLKTDTYSLNTKMNTLFKKLEFKLIGEMSFLGKEKPFYCYDKLLSISK